MNTMINKNLSVAITIWAIFSATSNGFAQADNADVSALSRKKFEWLINKQADSLTWLLDDRVMYIHSNGWIQSKREILEDMHSGKLVYKQVDVKEDQVRIYGNTALVTGIGKFSGNNGGNEFELHLVYTEVYIRKENRWVLVSRHANRLM